MKHQFNWKRFWYPFGGNPVLTDDGFLIDPEQEYVKYYDHKLVVLEDINNLPCLALLGEPGIGKSSEIEKLKTITNQNNSAEDFFISFIDLNQFGSEERLVQKVFKSSEFRQAKSENKVLYLFIDSLDECKLRIENISAILISEFKSEKWDKLKLRICCRVADWSKYLENGLKDIWGERNFGIYTLAPLRKKDIVIAANTISINVEDFFGELVNKKVIPFAIKPLTLNFLISLFLTNHSLPKNPKELYEEGCKILIKEDNPSRVDSNRIGKYSVQQKFTVAEGIAFLTMFCNKKSIHTNKLSSLVDEGDITIQEIYDAFILVGDYKNENTYEIIEETISTGLFLAKDENHRNWSHQTYCEFLAAQFIQKMNLTFTQLKALITIRVNSELIIIPQLSEIVAWAASCNPHLFRTILEFNPEVLIKRDLSIIGDESKETYVKELLRLFDAGMIYDPNYTLHHNYKNLLYPGLSDVLKEYLLDKTKQQSTRNEVIDIIEACNINNLQNELAIIILDENESINIRTNAGYALKKIADDETKAKLKPLLMSNLSSDYRDDLRGILLSCLWPKYLTAEELFTFFSDQKEEFGGAYVMFLYENPINQLLPADYIFALEWVANLSNIHSSKRLIFNDIIDSIMVQCLDNLNNPEILNAYTKALYHLIKEYRNFGSSAKYQDFSIKLSNNDLLRRLIIKNLMNSFTYPEKNLEVFCGVIHIVSNKDVKWMIEEVLNEEKTSLKRSWAKLARIFLDLNDTETREAILEKCVNSEYLYIEFESLIKPIELNSEEAKKQRKYYRKYLKPNRYNRNDRVLLGILIQEGITNLFNELKDGDLDAYWRLHLQLCYDPKNKNHHHETSVDITKFPGWKNLSKEQIELFNIKSKQFILEQDPKSDEWVGTDSYFRTAYAGYRALYLLLERNNLFIESLQREIWEKWAPTILAYQLFEDLNSKTKHHLLVSLAYKNAPEKILKTLDLLLRKECNQNEYVYITDKLNFCWDEKISAVVLKILKDDNIKISCFTKLLQHLLLKNNIEARNYAIMVLRNEDDNETMIQKRVAALEGLLLYDSEMAWPSIWVDILEYDTISKKMFLKIAYQSQRKLSFLENLNELQLADLFIWLCEHFPPKEDPEITGAHSVTAREELGRFRNSLITILKEKGTEDSLEAIKVISRKFPEMDQLRRFLYEAKFNVAAKNWNPIKPIAIMKIIGDSSMRIVQNEDDLLYVIIESLERLQIKIQGVNKPVIDLWNEVKHNIFRPKNENDLSNYINRHLHEDLIHKGIIANREVEIRSRYGTIPGEEPDILVQTIVTNGNRKHGITTVIETKCCWNQELFTAMKKQLYSRYLKNIQYKYGIYLVGWFNCKEWDVSDSRYAKASKLSIYETKQILEDQARSLSKENQVIKPFIINCALS